MENYIDFKDKSRKKAVLRVRRFSSRLTSIIKIKIDDRNEKIGACQSFSLRKLTDFFPRDTIRVLLASAVYRDVTQVKGYR